MGILSTVLEPTTGTAYWNDTDIVESPDPSVVLTLWYKHNFTHEQVYTIPHLRFGPTGPYLCTDELLSSCLLEG